MSGDDLNTAYQTTIYGPASGELLRERILEALVNTARVTVDLDGVVGSESVLAL